MFDNKKGNAIIIILIIILLVVIISWLVSLAGRECSSDSDCGSERYCGSDYTCHEFKVIQKTEVKYELLAPSFVIGLAIIAGAVILRYRKR